MQSILNIEKRTASIVRFISLTVLAALAFGVVNLLGQNERPDPGDPPNFTPGPPPLFGEIPPFPSNSENTVALVAFLHDPENNELILSLDSQSNAEFVLQTSIDLSVWNDTDRRIQGNKSIITFRVPVEVQQHTEFFRVIKR